MLSAETATGRYPGGDGRDDGAHRGAGRAGGARVETAPASGRRPTASPRRSRRRRARRPELLHAKAIVAFTQSGFTARLISQDRPEVPIMALTPFSEVQRRLGLYWGVSSRLVRKVETTDEMVEEVEATLLERRHGAEQRRHRDHLRRADVGDRDHQPAQAPSRRRPRAERARTGEDHGVRDPALRGEGRHRHHHPQPPRRLQRPEPDARPGSLPRRAGGGRGSGGAVRRDHRRREGLLRGRRRQGLRGQSGAHRHPGQGADHLPARRGLAAGPDHEAGDDGGERHRGGRRA